MNSDQRTEHLDWLRALAAGLVVIGHSQGWLAKGGAIGVSVFFVLSGYLIASILLREGMMTPGNIGKFIIRRIARIYPMYVFQIVIVTILLAIFHSDQYAILKDALPGLLFFVTDAPQHVGYGIAVLWTLAVEFWFYVTFPFLLWGALLTGRLFTSLGVGIAISVAAKLAGVQVATILYYDHFLIGALCAAAIRLGKVPSIFAGRYLFGAAICAILLIGQIMHAEPLSLAWISQGLGAALACGVAIMAGHARPPQVSLPLLAFLGRISYSIYMMHAVVLDVVLLKHHINESLLLPYLLIVVAVSTSTYFAIEQPIIKLVHRRVRFDTVPVSQIMIRTAL